MPKQIRTVEELKRNYEKLLPFFSENKQMLFQKVIAQRTRYITTVVENVFQPQNASAVLRTSDLLGIQDVHIVENNNTYKVNPQIALGSAKWLTLYKYSQNENNNILSAYSLLRSQGYRIVATTPHAKGVSLDNLSVDQGKIALIFGTELEGLSDVAIEHADEYVTIPMYGFTESFNISVSAALIMHHLIEKVRASNISWQLTMEEQYTILIEWALKVINHKRADLIDKFQQIAFDSSLIQE